MPLKRCNQQGVAKDICSCVFCKTIYSSNWAWISGKAAAQNEQKLMRSQTTAKVQHLSPGRKRGRSQNTCAGEKRTFSQMETGREIIWCCDRTLCQHEGLQMHGGGIKRTPPLARSLFLVVVLPTVKRNAPYLPQCGSLCCIIVRPRASTYRHSAARTRPASPISHPWY